MEENAQEVQAGQEAPEKTEPQSPLTEKRGTTQNRSGGALQKTIKNGNICIVLPASGVEFDIAAEVQEEQKKNGAPFKGEGRRFRAGLFARLLIACALVLLLAVDIWILGGYLDDDTLEVSFYRASSDKVTEAIRIVQLSDLHDKQFGRENAILVERVRDLKPDIILLTGDMVTMNKTTSFVNLQELCSSLTEIAPTFAVAGNHESGIQFHGEEVDWNIGKLKEFGVHVLSRSTETVSIGAQKVTIGGFYCSEEGFQTNRLLQKYMDEFQTVNPETVKILLIHEPNVYINQLSGYSGVDFVFSGHAHGGQIRLPMVGAVYAPDQGLFPKHTSGLSYIGDTGLLISRGLGNEYSLPRFNNRPELLVLDVER